MTTKTAQPEETVDELRARLAAAEARDLATATEKMQRLHAAQTAWQQDLVKRSDVIERDLEDLEGKAWGAAQAAAAKGDMSDALTHYCRWLALRDARSRIRNLTIGAANALHVDPPHGSMLSFVRPNFAEFLETGISAFVVENGGVYTSEYITEMPTDPELFA